MLALRRPRLQVACAVLAVAAGLAAQFVTRVALVEDIGMVAVVVGLATLAMVVPALLTGSSPRGGNRSGGPPPTAPQ